jgi:hypothetical protein
MRSTIVLTVAVALLSGVASAQASSQSTSTDAHFKWSGTVPKGEWVRVKNLNGRVTVRAASGNTVVITGEKTSRRGDPNSVRIVTQKTGNGGILVCAFWTENASCDEDSYSSHSDGEDSGRHSRDVSVDFTVSLPAGVNVLSSSVNGDVEVDGATAEVDVHTVNGDVRGITSSGPVSAGTVNGSITAKMRSLPGNADLDFRTVNGSIDLELPTQLDADVELRTVNGGFQTDFPMTLSGRVSPRRLNATIGKGGRRLRATTVNGSIELRKSS